MLITSAMNMMEHLNMKIAQCRGGSRAAATSKMEVSDNGSSNDEDSVAFSFSLCEKGKMKIEFRKSFTSSRKK